MLGGALCTWYGQFPGSRYIPYPDIIVQRIYSDGTPGGVSGEPITGVQCSVRTFKSWPNPFTAAITFSYTLPRKAKISLKIYNIAGQLVKNIVEEERHEGGYNAIWDGRDNNGQNMPSGMYFASLSVYGKTDIRKLVKIK